MSFLANRHQVGKTDNTFLYRKHNICEITVYIKLTKLLLQLLWKIYEENIYFTSFPNLAWNSNLLPKCFYFLKEQRLKMGQLLGKLVGQIFLPLSGKVLGAYLLWDNMLYTQLCQEVHEILQFSSGGIFLTMVTSIHL